MRDAHSVWQSKLTPCLVVWTGISGSGKTYLSRVLHSAYSDLTFVEFGAMLAEVVHQRFGHIPQDQDHVRSLDLGVLSLAVDEVVDRIHSLSNDSMKPVVVNTHTVYKQQGVLQVPIRSFDSLSPSQYVFISAQPDQILEWRQLDRDRYRDLEAVRDIQIHQDLARSATIFLAARHRASFLELPNAPSDTATADIVDRVGRLLLR